MHPARSRCPGVFAALAAIERIEILRGSDAVLYGGGAFDNYVDTRTRVWSFTPRRTAHRPPG